VGGEVYVEPISDDPHRFDPGATLVRDDDSQVVVESSRRHNDRLLVKFAGVDSRSDAELARGPLYVRRGQERSLDEGEFWERDLIGCEVFVGETLVGVVERVDHDRFQDRVVVATDQGERLVPMVKEIVVQIDVAARRMVVDPPPGLLT
jgi:16S rRNA processing protein RimM